MGFVEQVDHFIKQVENVYEVDYGDFKRKVSQYVLRLEQALGSEVRPEARSILREMHARILFYPNSDIELARETAIALARKLKG